MEQADKDRERIEAAKAHLRGEATTPEEQKEVENLIARMDLGLTGALQSKLLGRDWQRETLNALTENMTSEERDGIERLVLARKLKINPKNMPGTIDALKAQLDYDTAVIEKEMTNLKLSQMKHLTVDEADALGVEYGTTREKAWALGLYPNRFELKVVDGALHRIDTVDRDAEEEVVVEARQGLEAEDLKVISSLRKTFEAKKV